MTIGQKYRNFSFLLIVIVLTLGFIYEYIIYGNMMRHTTDDVLMEYRHSIEKSVARTDSILLLDRLINRHRILTKLTHRDSIRNFKERIYDTTIYNPYAESQILFRAIQFPLQARNEYYIVRFALPAMEQQELSMSIILSSVFFFIIFIIASFVGMRYMERITHPFYELLNQMRNYDIRSSKSQPEVKAEVDELQEFDRGLHSMMNHMHHDYGALKELMEYSSHELQTPLAVISMKVEQLSQLCEKNEEQLKYLIEIRNSLHRLSHMNRSVLLISRISSDHFYRQEDINLEQVLGNMLSEHEEILEAAQITVEWTEREPFEVKLHPVLADMLIGNLLSNAIKYNMPEGRIVLHATDDELMIRNTYSNTIPEGDLFDRYVCTKDHKEATGLGLTIVREICLHNELEVKACVTEKYFNVSLRHKDEHPKA